MWAVEGFARQPRWGLLVWPCIYSLFHFLSCLYVLIQIAAVNASCPVTTTRAVKVSASLSCE